MLKESEETRKLEKCLCFFFLSDVVCTVASVVFVVVRILPEPTGAVKILDIVVCGNKLER